LQMLHDLQESLSDLVEPAADYASDLKNDGVRAMKRGMHSMADSRLLGRIRDLFS
jgi:hypothetical protein